jgi:uncharacterized membrane protein
MSKGRIEAFGDRIIAIVITIMIPGLQRAEGVTIGRVHPLP